MSKLDLFNNLMIMAAADGFAREEIEYLAAKSHAWGISTGDVEAAIVGAKDGEIHLPDEAEEREETLREMIKLMAVDGKISGIEMRICAIASARMDFTTRQFEAILDEVIVGNDQSGE
jgi:hypothetical protein